MFTADAHQKTTPAKPVGSSVAKIDRPLKVAHMPEDVFSGASAKVLARRVDLLRKLAK